MKIKRTFIRVAALLLVCITALCGCDGGGVYHSPNVGGGGARPAFKDEGTSDTQTASESTAVNGEYTKRVALTLDDGPHVTRTIEIADALEKYGYHATFFVVGNRVDGSEYRGGDAMKYAYDKGNEIAIHAYTHDCYYSTCTDSQYNTELSKTHKAISAKLPNAKVKLMRPVGGEITSARVQSCKYSVIMWNVDSEDWKYTGRKSESEKQKNIDTIVDNVMSSVSDGSIILMHDIHANTAEAIPIILERLHAEGYDVVTVSELLGNPAAGKKYSHG